MSDNIPSYKIRRIFLDLCYEEIKLPLGFFNELMKIAGNIQPILEILNKHHISLNTIHQKLLYRKYANAIFSQAYFCLKLIIQSRKKFNSKIVALVNTHQNYHASNIMHQPVIDMLESMTLSENIFLTPQLIEKRQTFFCDDNIHLNRYGAKTLFYRVRDLITIMARFFSERENCDLDYLKNQLSEHYTSVKCKVIDRAVYSRFREPVDHIYDRQHYPRQSSSKRMGMYFSCKKLGLRGKFPLAHLNRQLLAVLLTTSMFRDFICKSLFSIRNREQNTMFPVPCGITINPGALAYHIQRNITESVLLADTNHTAYVSVIYIGSNEKSALYDLVMQFLCSEKLFKHGCSICGKGKKKNPYKFYLGHMKLDFLDAFIELFR